MSFYDYSSCISLHVSGRDAVILIHNRLKKQTSLVGPFTSALYTLHEHASIPILSHGTRKSVFGVLDQVRLKPHAQLQKQARVTKLQIYTELIKKTHRWKFAFFTLEEKIIKLKTFD